MTILGKPYSTPEIDKMKEQADLLKTQECGEFLTWLRSQGIVLAHLVQHQHNSRCRRSCYQFELQMMSETPDKLLARYAGVDMEVVEAERRMILASLKSSTD